MILQKEAIMLPVVLFASIIIIIIAYFINYSNPAIDAQKSSELTVAHENLPTPTVNLFKSEEKFTLTGIVYTSGLTYEERGVLNAFSDFQLEKTPISKGWPEGKIYGVYLEPNEMGFRKYLGNCVSIEGNTKKGWEGLESKSFEINGKWTYNRSVLIVDKVELKNIRDCIDDYDLAIADEKILKTLDRKILTGTLRFTNGRPSPDISYDLEIKLDEPFIDEMSASGRPFLVTILDIQAATDDVHIQVLENIGKEVELEGYIEWGYAESRFFRVTSLNTQ